ncbi:unnamed protein product, partial [Meganyctiphanes norvegica]
INGDSGLVTTALCCLDREITPFYNLQVIATDGGGLKGTGTVVVRLADVNDNSPRLIQPLWEIKVVETWGAGPSDNSTLLKLSARDQDSHNHFYYRVVPHSGWGWQQFGVRSVGTVGELFANQVLDYEDPNHRRGFRFMVQVTDKGINGWEDARHVDAAWVTVHLIDVNDNPPEFLRDNARITIREDTPTGTLLATFTAQDIDAAESGKIEYKVSGVNDALEVDESGSVRLLQSLDREAISSNVAMVQVIAKDKGDPPLSATATLSITLTDVNDCSPHLKPPLRFHTREGSRPTRLAMLTATDDDVWAAGNGPPFKFALDKSNTQAVLQNIKLHYRMQLDSGRGGAELWTSRPLDREQHPHLDVKITVTDNGGLSSTDIVSIIVDDENDNRMKPGKKTVFLWKTRSGAGEMSLGRIWVNDPDDWDAHDKQFQWAREPNPLFSLNNETGFIKANQNLPNGRHELQFVVSDKHWGQQQVSANVSVDVRLLHPEAIIHAAAITMVHLTPAQLTSGWTPKNKGGYLGHLITSISRTLGESLIVELVSIYSEAIDAHSSNTNFSHAYADTKLQPINSEERLNHRNTTPSGVCLWVAVRDTSGHYMNPTRLQGLLLLNSHKLEKVVRTGVKVKGSYGSSGITTPLTLFYRNKNYPASAASSHPSMALNMQLVDANNTAIVTPLIHHSRPCWKNYAPNLYMASNDHCVPGSCLNGGRCINTQEGNRCICPGGSWGRECKILTRSFEGSGWIWVEPPTTCLPTQISLRVLTLQTSALLLYYGPMTSPSKKIGLRHSTPMMALQLQNGKPELILQGEEIDHKLVVDATVNDGEWHTLHVILNHRGAVLQLDYCGKGWQDHQHTQDDSHCVVRKVWKSSRGILESIPGPLQIGGTAHSIPNADTHRWTYQPTSHKLHGCIDSIRVNQKLVDIGSPPLAHGSKVRCGMQESMCEDGCGLRGHCTGGIKNYECSCDPGWHGKGCRNPTMPVRVGLGSYLNVALSFTPNPFVLHLQLRIRTRQEQGLLLLLASQQRQAIIKLELQEGSVCMVVNVMSSQRVCVMGVSDGTWHVVMAERHGDNMLIAIDDGDDWRSNQSLINIDLVFPNVN